ncbi:hypothetical protein ACFLQS_04755 [Actinomycetota bacterium]
MINKRLKKVLLILPFFLVIIGVVMLFMPGMVSGITDGPICDGSYWNSNGSGNSVTVSGTITAIKIKAGNDISGPITVDEQYGHNVLVEAAGDPDGSGCSSLTTSGMFVLDGSAPAGYEWFGYYDVVGIGTNSVTVTVHHLTGQADCVIQNVSHLEYICDGTTTTTDPGTTTTTDPGTTTTTDPGTTTTTDPGTTTTTTDDSTTTTTEATTTTTEATTTTTEATTTTTTDDSTTTTTDDSTTTTTEDTTTTTDETTTTEGTTSTTTPTTESTTSTATEQSLAVLALTGFNSLWYVIGSILIGLGVIVGSYSLSTSLKRR